MSSFLKLIDKTTTADKLSFHRAHIDGMPFRGPKNVMLREEEWEEYSETVKDCGAEVFDLADEKHKEKIREIVEGQQNGYYQILRFTESLVPQPDGSLKVYVFCVWSFPVKELAQHRLPTGLVNAT